MLIGSGEQRYEWVDNWAAFPDSESARTGHAHHGLVVTESGQILTFHPGEPVALLFDQNGNLQDSWHTNLSNAHDMDLVKEGNSEYLWLADNLSGQVVKTTLDGKHVMKLQLPELAIYVEGKYSPTSVAVYQEQHGGNDDVWVADGYGESYVHRYDRNGNFLGSINGTEGDAGAFKQPHGIFVDHRGASPELYVADRQNSRVQVYDLDGHFKRTFGTEFLYTPSSFIASRDSLMIVEHRASRLTVLDVDDQLVCYIGENLGAESIEGFPNIPRDLHEPGKFVAPHGMAADAAGNLYVEEWLVGGRTIKLVKK